MNQEELIAKIDAFLWELLPEDERLIVQKEIDNNPDFRAMVAEKHFQHAVIKRMKKEALTAKLKGLREKTATENAKEDPSVKTIKLPQIAPSLPKITPEKRGRILPLRRVLAMAASVALLVTIGSYYWAKGNYDALKVSNGFYATLDPMPEDDDKPAGGNTGETSDFDTADKAFIDRDFKGMVAIYKEILVKKGENTEGSLFDKKIKEYTQWRLILAYLAAEQGDNPEFSALLKNIMDNQDHEYHKQAVELDKKINTFWWRLAN